MQTVTHNQGLLLIFACMPMIVSAFLAMVWFFVYSGEYPAPTWIDWGIKGCGIFTMIGFTLWFLEALIPRSDNWQDHE